MKIKYMTLISFINSYENDSPSIRFGQAFCNYFKILDQELFNEDSMSKAICIIFKKYITY